MKRFIPVSEPLLTGNEKKYLQECIDTGWISSEGPFVKKFEEEFAAKVGRTYGIAVANGTAALEIAAKAIGIQKGDEVVMPSFTIISCAQAVAKEGGVIRTTDCSPDDYNMNVDEVEPLINERTKAIMPVHIYGLPVNMDKIAETARKYNLKIIEDAAEMHGQKYNEKPCGSFGDISVFSFYANKIVTTGEGGMIVCDDPELAEQCRFYRNLCFENTRRFVHFELGFNYRFTNLQAAVGLAQLERLDEFTALKRKIGKTYNALFADNPYLQIPVDETANAKNIYWVYPLLIKPECNYNADYVMNELKKYGIGSRPFFYPIHKQPALKTMGAVRNDISHPNAEYIADKGFYVPSSLTLTDDDIRYIADCVNNVVS